MPPTPVNIQTLSSNQNINLAKPKWAKVLGIIYIIVLLVVVTTFYGHIPYFISMLPLLLSAIFKINSFVLAFYILPASIPYLWFFLSIYAIITSLRSGNNFNFSKSQKVFMVLPTLLVGLYFVQYFVVAYNLQSTQNKQNIIMNNSIQKENSSTAHLNKKVKDVAEEMKQSSQVIDSYSCGKINFNGQQTVETCSTLNIKINKDFEENFSGPVFWENNKAYLDKLYQPMKMAVAPNYPLNDIVYTINIFLPSSNGNSYTDCQIISDQPPYWSCYK